MNNFEFLYKDENVCVRDFSIKFFRWLEGLSEEEFLQNMHERIGVLSQGCLLELIFYLYFQKYNPLMMHCFKPLTSIDRYSVYFSYEHMHTLVDAVMHNAKWDVEELWYEHKVKGSRTTKKILVAGEEGPSISDFDFMLLNKGTRRTKDCIVIVPEDRRNFFTYENALNNLDCGKHPILINEIYVFNGLKHMSFQSVVDALEQISYDYDYDKDRCKFVVLDREFAQRLAKEKPLSNIEQRTLMRNGR
jgi:hypothetical protein